MIKDIIYFAKVRPDAIIPTNSEENAGWDCYACFDEEYRIIQPFTSELIPLGIATAFHPMYWFSLRERGSTGFINMKVGGGVIDSGFRNQWQAILYNGNTKPIMITKETNENVLESLKDDYITYPYSKAVVQGIFTIKPTIIAEEKTYEDLLKIPSERNLGMLGSSGK